MDLKSHSWPRTRTLFARSPWIRANPTIGMTAWYAFVKTAEYSSNHITHFLDGSPHSSPRVCTARLAALKSSVSKPSTSVLRPCVAGKSLRSAARRETWGIWSGDTKSVATCKLQEPDDHVRRMRSCACKTHKARLRAVQLASCARTLHLHARANIGHLVSATSGDDQSIANLLQNNVRPDARIDLQLI
eukprot:scaffold40072_cov25-Tisochrysis_lutea.AAC.1